MLNDLAADPRVPRAIKAVLPVFVGGASGWIVALHYINHNYDQSFPGEMIWLLVAVVVWSAALHAAVYCLVREKNRAAICAALANFLFLNCDGPYVNFSKYVHLGSYGRLGFLALVFVFLLVMVKLIERLATDRVWAIESILGVTASVLLCVNCWNIAAHITDNWGVDVAVQNDDLIEAATQVSGRAKPDIYYIMPDDYVGNVSLTETYGFDNRPFVEQLHALGYYVPSQSFSNYPVTATSLASSINGGLLQPSGDYKKATASPPVYRLIRKPAVARFLQKQGYSFTQLGSWWNPTQTSEYADEDLRYAYGITFLGHRFYLSETAGVFLNKTILRPVFETGVRIRGFTVLSWQGADPGEIFLQQAEHLKTLAALDGPPRFVFAHLLMPHYPFVFDADGGPSPSRLSDKERYLRQVQFTNKKLIEIAQAIQDTARGRASIVVVASDEGQFPDNDTIAGTDRQLRHKSNTFATLYFPDRDYSQLYPTITPVNYFRVVFNMYFGTHLELMPDTVFAHRTSKTFLLDLADVTGRVRPHGSLETN